MKPILGCIPSFFFQILLCGCVFAQDNPQSCFNDAANDAYVLAGTDEFLLNSFSSEHQDTKILYINDIGGAQVSIHFDQTPKPNNLVLTYNEAGITIIEKSQEITCSTKEQLQTKSIDLIKVSDGLLLKAKPDLINQLPHERWFFLKQHN